MDTSFSCPKCNLHITADECVVGEEIDCPECGEKFRVPPAPKPRPVPVVVKSAGQPASPGARPVAVPAAHAHPAPSAATHVAPQPAHTAPANPATTTTTAHGAHPAAPEPPKPAAHVEHKPLTVPHHHGPAESLVKKTHVEHKDEPPKIRVKTIKRGSCVEVGHDLFDEKVTEFLNKVGQENIIHMSAISYGAMDSTGHMLPDYGIMVIYKG